MGRRNTQKIIARTLGHAPPLQPLAFLDNLVRGDALFDLNGQKIMNVWYWKFSDPPTIFSLSTLAEVFQTAWGDHIAPLLSDEMIFTGITMRDLSGPDGIVLPFVSEPPIPGGNTSGDVAPFVAAKIRLQTLEGGRKALGWKRIAGLVGTQFNLGLWLTTPHNAMQAALNEFFDAITDTGLTLVVASFILNGVPRSTPVTTEVIGLNLLTDVTTQNSRKYGRGD